LVFNWAGSSAISVPGAIGGGGAITKLGSGEIDLGGAGTFTGTTTITAGTLGVGGATPLGTNSGGTTIAAGGRLLTLGTINIPGSITVAGNYDGGIDGAIQASGGTSSAAVTATLSGPLNLSGSTQLAANQYSTLAVNGSIGGSGNLSLVGSGIITIAGGNAGYSGATSVAAGTTVQVQNSANLGSSITVAAGGELFANSGATDSYAAPITISGAGVDAQLGALRSGGGQLHTFTGPVTLAGNTSFSVDASAQLNITGNVTGNNTNLTLVADAGVPTAGVPVNAATGRILGNLNLGTGSLTTSTVTAANIGGTWVLGGNATYGATNINAGSVLQIGNGGASGNLGSGAVSDNGGLNFNLTGTYNVTQAISGSGTVSQNVTATGGGTVVLSGNNSYSGITTIGVFSNLNIGTGVLSVTNSSALGNTTGVYIVGNGATTSLDLNGGSSGLSFSAPFFFSGRALTGTNTVPVGITSEGNNTLSGTFTLNTGGSAYGFQSNSGLLTVSGAITNTTATTTERYLYLSGAGNGLITGKISSSATSTAGPGIGVVKDGTGTWTLNMTTNDSTDSITGDVIVKQGTLAIQGYPPVGQGLAATKIPTSITVYSGANYDLSHAEGGSSSLQFLQTLAGTGNVIMGSGGTLGAFPDNTISAGLAGAPGTLKIQGNLETSVDGVANDAPYTGTVLSFGLDTSPSGNSDALSITGSLNADDTTYVTVTPLGASMAGTYTLLNAAGGINNGGNVALQNTTRYNMSLNTTSNQVQVTIGGSVGNLTWSGSNSTWDTKNTVAWNGAPNGDGLFWTADNVTFDDNGAANPAVNITGTVTPGSITVSANNTNYSFNTGTLAGGGSLAKSGTGTLTINTANTYTGKTTITNGVLIAGNSAALGSSAGDTEISGSGTLDVNNFSMGAEKITVAGNGFNGEGALVNNGTSATNNAGGQLTTWATQSITLTGDATIGGTSRWDLRDSSTGANDAYLIGNRHSLIKTGASEVWLVGAQVSNVPTITVNSGNLGLEDVSFTNTGGLTSIIDNSAMLTFWSNTPPAGQILNLNLSFNGATTVSINDNDAGPSTVNGTMAVNGPSAWTASVPFNVGATLSGGGVITKTGASPLTLSGGGTLGGLTISAASVVNVTANTSVGQLLGVAGATLNVAGAKLSATNQNHATITLGSLTLPNNGTLDIGNGNLVIPYTGASPLNTIVGYIKSGYDGGKWDQSGLVTSAALTTRGTILAYRDTGTQVQVKYTWFGDLDFTGTVDSTSLTMMTAGNGTSWTQGDLNYDGVKNSDDWSLFMLGAASQNGSIPAGVPEPATLGLTLASTLLFTSRRRRK
jgi:fibronectin-binding autotransporter adhesin